MKYMRRRKWQRAGSDMEGNAKKGRSVERRVVKCSKGKQSENETEGGGGSKWGMQEKARSKILTLKEVQEAVSYI